MRSAPGIALALLLALTAVATAGLGRWQLRRMHEKDAWLTEMRARTGAAAAPLAAALADPEGHAYRRVRGSGRWRAADTLLLDNQSQDRTIGNRVLTPLEPDAGGPLVLVERGFITRSRAQEIVDDPRLPGHATIEGVALPLPGRTLDVEPGPHRVHWTRIHHGAMQQQLGAPLARLLVVQQSPADPRLAGRTPEPRSRVNHWHYALTWLSISAIAAISAVLAARRSWLARRSATSGPGDPQAAR